MDPGYLPHHIRQALTPPGPDDPQVLIEPPNYTAFTPEHPEVIDFVRLNSTYPRTAETLCRLFSALDRGLPRHFAAAQAGVSFDTLQLWMQKEPEFEAAVKRCEARFLGEQLDGIARSGAAHPRFWAARAWLAERRFPQDYGQRQDRDDGPRIVVQVGVALPGLPAANTPGVTIEATPLPILEGTPLPQPGGPVGGRGAGRTQSTPSKKRSRTPRLRGRNAPEWAAELKALEAAKLAARRPTRPAVNVTKYFYTSKQKPGTNDAGEGGGV